MDPPPGCRFHTRCPSATDICRNVEPPLTLYPGGHEAACHHPVDVGPIGHRGRHPQPSGVSVGRGGIAGGVRGFAGWSGHHPFVMGRLAGLLTGDRRPANVGFSCMTAGQSGFRLSARPLRAVVEGRLAATRQPPPGTGPALSWPP